MKLKSDLIFGSVFLFVTVLLYSGVLYLGLYVWPTDWEAYYAKQREAERRYIEAYIKQHGKPPEPYHSDNFIETLPW